MKHKTRLVIGNWKMNPATLPEAKRLFLKLRDKVRVTRYKSEAMVAPPFPFIAELNRLSPQGRIGLVAQHMSALSLGAKTGEVSAAMLKSIGVEGVIIGHSERRADGMTDEAVNALLLTALKAKFLPIVCVGETARDQSGDFYDLIERQIRRAFVGVPKSKLAGIVIAYEPVWAIGSGATAGPEDILETKLFIQKVIVQHFDRAAAGKIRIIYGGSVNARNAEAILAQGQVDGFLVGGASLRADEFLALLKIASE